MALKGYKVMLQQYFTIRCVCYYSDDGNMRNNKKLRPSWTVTKAQKNHKYVGVSSARMILLNNLEVKGHWFI
jgi:hypothetical protein